jgi:competence protein ComEC
MAGAPVTSLAPHVVAAPVARLRDTPLLIWIAGGLVTGDVLAGSAELRLPWFFLAIGACGAGLGVFCGAALRRLACCLLAALHGYLAADAVYRPVLPEQHIVATGSRYPQRIQGTLIAEPEPRLNGARLRVAVTALATSEGWRPATGDILVTVRQLQQSWVKGDRLEARLRIRRVRNFGNPGEFDYEGYLARRGIHATAWVGDDGAFVRQPGNGGLTAPLARWRRRVAALFGEVLAQPDAAVMQALIVGTSSALPTELRRAFSRAGVSHVLAISGLHVGLVAATAYGVLRWLLARSRWLLLATHVPKLAVVLSVVPVLLYAGIAGGTVATVRAVIMVIVFLVAVIVDRQRHLVVSLAVAAIAILLTAPGSGRDVSFQLSFAAVLGLLFGMQRFWPWWLRWEEVRLARLRGWRGRLWRPIAVYVAVTMSALAATLPLTALHFNQISLMSLLANAIVVPLLGSVAVSLGLLAALTEPFVPLFARGAVMLAGPVVELSLICVTTLAAVPGAAIRVPTPAPWELALLYCIFFATVQFAGAARLRLLAVLTVLAVADVTWWYASRHWQHDLRVTFLSVGHGDSAVVELPHGEVMVIDGGGLRGETFDVGERLIAPFLWHRRIMQVDYLVLSHPHWDHYGGMRFLAEQFAPREFWTAGATATSARFRALQMEIDRAGVSTVHMHRGAERKLGAVHIAILSPPRSGDTLDRNDDSLVLRLSFGDVSVLFPGDIEASTELRLVATRAEALGSAILKIPHHGSRTSSTPAFVDAVAPWFAIASVGFDNPWDLPHPDVIARYRARAVGLARTDADGAVELRITSAGRVTARRHRHGRESMLTAGAFARRGDI